MGLLFFLPNTTSGQTLVVTRSANIREDPSVNKEPIGRLNAGDTVHRLEPQNIGGYGLVQFGQIEGWVWLRNTRVVQERISERSANEATPLLSVTCSVDGDASNSRQIAADRLKNRTKAPSVLDMDSSVTLARMLRPGKDDDRFNELKGGEIVGFVERVKPGDVETNNCHSPFPEDYDTHIELSLNPGRPPSKRVIVEVTPRVRMLTAAISGKDWSTNTLKRTLTHKWVRVTGWMFFDYHHKGNASNTNPGGSHIWRATVWEIHPITDIRVCPGDRNTC